MFFLRVIDALEKANVRYAVAGGYALSLHGVVRGTVDIDIVIRTDRSEYRMTQDALATIGLRPKLPIDAEEVFNFREEYIRNRNLIAWSFCNPDFPSEIVDVVITHDLSNMRTITVPFRGRNICLLSMDELIAMKKGSPRPQDAEDARALGIARGIK